MEVKVTSEGQQTILFVSGQIDTLTASDFQSHVFSAIDQGEYDIVLDLSAVTYISSAGLRIFLMAQKAVSQHGHTISIRHLSPALKTIFDVSGFTQLFHFE